MKSAISSIIATWLFVGATAHAQVQRTIRYDGRLEQNGRPADGGYDLGFALFDAAQAGNQLWPAAADAYATLRVTVSNGQFIVELGGQGMEALGWQVFAAPRVFVQTRVNGTALNGRRAIGSVPFASRADNGVPAGTLIPWTGRSDRVPSGWRLADGSVVSGDLLPELYAAVGEVYGDGGDGPGPLFHLPDMRGRVAVGGGQLNGNGSAAGVVGTKVRSSYSQPITHAELPPHQHAGGTGEAYATRGFMRVVEGNGAGFASNHVVGWAAGPFRDFAPDGEWNGRAHAHDFVTNNGPGAGAPLQTNDPSLVVNYLIKI